MIKVFIIDDSLVVRNGFKNMLKDVSEIEIIGDANNPIDAFSIFKKVGLPDLFILDIEMPKMDGLTFLKKINAQRPTPVIICSSLVTSGSSASIDALRLGASDVIAKPVSGLNKFFIEYKSELISKILSIGKSKINVNLKLHTKIKNKNINNSIPSSKIIGIGSSTGGVQVLEEILINLKEDHVGVVIVQHMPAGFTLSFANRLNEICPNSHVSEAKDGDIITNGKVLIAPGGKHMLVYKDGLKYKIRIKDFPKVNSHRPSVNVLFKTLATEVKANATGFILTGMGNDGATSLKMMSEAGSNTYAQNEKSSTVFGMPRVAQEIGATKEMLSIDNITKKMNLI